MKKWIATLTALLLTAALLPSLAEAQPTIPATDPVLATINGKPVLKSEADRLIPALLNYEIITSAADYQYAVEYIVRQKVLEMKIADMGFDVFTDEEKAAFEAESQAEWDRTLGEYVSYYLSEDTQEARDTLREQAITYYTSQGYTLEEVYNNALRKASIDRMGDYLLGDYVPTDAEIDEVFQNFGGQYRQRYENNIAGYEFMTQYYGEESWYTPAGYRGVIHILLKVDQALLDEYSSLQASYEEQQSMLDAEQTEQTEPAEATDAPEGTAAPSPEPVTEDMVQAAKERVLNSVQDKIDDIYKRLADGEAFEALISQYGEDPGMTDEGNLADGYMVHESSVLWDPAFTGGAFSDKMQAVGDVSDPVIGKHGIHILKYQRDVPSGLIMTDAIREDIVAYLTSVRENNAYNETYAMWVLDMDIVYNEAAIQSASDAAAAQQAESEDNGTGELLQVEPLDATEAPEDD